MAFYHGILGILLDKQDVERGLFANGARTSCVADREQYSSHQGGGPLHFAMTVSEEEFEKILGKFEGDRYFTRGPYGKKG